MSILQEISVPQETVNDEFATVAEKYFENGDKVEHGETLIDIETSKAVVAIEAEKAGFIEYFCEEGDDVSVGDTIIKIYDSVPAPSKETEIEDLTAPAKSASAVETIYSKKALALLSESDIEKSSFTGHDFVSVHDVRALLSPEPKQESVIEERRTPVVEPDIKTDKVDLEKLSTQKRIEIKYLSQVQSSGLTSTINIYVDIEGIFQFVNKHMEVFKNSLMPIIIYETARLLSKHRDLNAYFAGENIAYYKEVNIGIAVDIDDGLKVLKLPGTDNKSLKEIETEILDLSNKYLDRKLTLDDISGTTFTITDLSSEGVDFFVPLVNKEQSAILGVSSIDEKLKRCVLTLTFDHRVMAGKQASIFLGELKIRIESYDLAKDEDKANELLKLRQSERCGVCMKTLEDDEELQGIGLIKILDHSGIEKKICMVCLSRF